MFVWCHCATTHCSLCLPWTFPGDAVGYDAGRWAWWEAVILTRKFLIMCIVVFIDDVSLQGACHLPDR